MSETFHIVLTTCPSSETATALAEQLIEAKLAACINVIPGVRSYYEWKGKLETGTEHLLLIKSRCDVFDALQIVITSAHPYELPEIIAVPITAGSSPYLVWLDSTMRTPK